MLTLTKVLHVLSLGLWFGGAVFFSLVVALSLFRTFEGEAVKPAEQRPSWFPVAAPFDRNEETRKEQGTRAAGAAVSPLFDWYFLMQGACGFVAVLTALAWCRSGATVHNVRFALLLLALVTVVAGWPIERYVSELRTRRNATRDVVLQSDAPTPEQEQAAAEARKAFGTWHFYSLMLNFLTLALLTGGMALAAKLPPEPAQAESASKSDSTTEPATSAAPPA